MKSKTYIDQLGNSVAIANYPPQRIISLVPSQTELLFDLGLANEIVGITQFCEHPAAVKLKNKIGGTKRFNLKAIAALQPDLIIGNKEENYHKGIEQLQQHYPVWMSDVANLADAYVMITKIAEITAKHAMAEQLILCIQQEFEKLSQCISKQKIKPQVAYLIWRKPYMVAGKNTFIDAMLQQCGLNNVFSHLLRYPSIDVTALIKAKPQFIFLSSEPFPFKEKHILEFHSLCPDAKVIIVDGQLFSWYGSRLQYAPNYFKKLFWTNC